MLNKRCFLTVFSTLSLLLLIVLAGCGGGGEKTSIPTVTQMPTATPPTAATPTAVPTLTAMPTNIPSGPVKIGAITSWSGPTAMSGLYYADRNIKLVEWQVKQTGGILGGREVKFIKYDDRSSVAESVAGGKKITH